MKWTRKKPTKPGHYWFRAWGKKNVVVIAHHPDAEIDAWRVCAVEAGEYGTALKLFPENECEWSDQSIAEPIE